MVQCCSNHYSCDVHRNYFDSKMTAFSCGWPGWKWVQLETPPTDCFLVSSLVSGFDKRGRNGSVGVFFLRKLSLLLVVVVVPL